MAKVAIFSLNTHFLLDFGDLDKSFSLGNAHAWHCAHLITILLFMRRWYSSCAWLDKLGSASANRTSSFAFGHS